MTAIGLLVAGYWLWNNFGESTEPTPDATRAFARRYVAPLIAAYLVVSGLRRLRRARSA